MVSLLGNEELLVFVLATMKKKLLVFVKCFMFANRSTNISQILTYFPCPHCILQLPLLYSYF